MQNAIRNQFGQPIGHPLSPQSARPLPEDITLVGRTCRLEPLQQRHVDDLYAAYIQAADSRDWTYMFAGPFQSLSDYRDYVKGIVNRADPKHYAIIDSRLNKPVGTLALMRIDPNMGVVEVGHVALSRLLQKKTAATEAQYLLMKYAFDTLGYRRYEWKCDSLNWPSRQAAERLGFSFEGIFRQAVFYKERNRDTAWFSIIDQEWPILKSAFEIWLTPENFDSDDQQIKTFGQIRQERCFQNTSWI